MKKTHKSHKHHKSSLAKSLNPNYTVSKLSAAVILVTAVWSFLIILALFVKPQ